MLDMNLRWVVGYNLHPFIGRHSFDCLFTFQISILGESFSEQLEVFNQISHRFKSELIHCGFVENVTDYYRVLQNADVVVSTAIHEFFGVAV